MHLVKELTNIYLTKENWHRSKLTEEQANEYHERLLMQGNILTYVKNGELIGYLEFYRITFEQLGRSICGIQLPVFDEDIVSGNIAMVRHMYIKEEYRNGEAFDMLSTMFLVKNQDAEYFVAVKANKKNQPLQVYTRDELRGLYGK